MQFLPGENDVFRDGLDRFRGAAGGHAGTVAERRGAEPLPVELTYAPEVMVFVHGHGQAVIAVGSIEEWLKPLKELAVYLGKVLGYTR
ncbi:MAG: hypothetical protein AAF968_14255 [Pseudomonadota bacterium]